MIRYVTGYARNINDDKVFLIVRGGSEIDYVETNAISTTLVGDYIDLKSDPRIIKKTVHILKEDEDKFDEMFSGRI